jgi:tetratricopeptide (TPR) repeat protein
MIRWGHSMALVAFFAATVLNVLGPSVNAVDAEAVVPGNERPTLDQEVVRLYREGFSDAVPPPLESLALAEKIFGSASAHYATGLNNLASFYKVMGRYDDALPLYGRALEIDEKTLGAEHPGTATGLNSLAFLCQAMGRYDEALGDGKLRVADMERWNPRSANTIW